MRSLAWVSWATFLVLPYCPAGSGQTAPAKQNTRRNETRLARLVPGRSSLKAARAVWRTETTVDSANHWAVWLTCAGDELNVEYDERGIVQSVRVTKEAKTPDCGEAKTSVAAARVTTGLGLRLGSPTQLVVQLYGQPDSRSPSTKDGQQLELLYYAFDWAGPDVPQVMEVLCTVEKDGKPGRVVEITLAASSL